MANRKDTAETIARSGGALALEYFAKLATLEIEDKGPQDFVTAADKDVETHVRALIEEAFPEDGIVGEEHAPKPSGSGYTWVIDPIDGTANFISNIPAWCVVIAVVK
ncbi:MAG: inositol monophosphatase family protein, partial [Paracoccaceae bacterium]